MRDDLLTAATTSLQGVAGRSVRAVVRGVGVDCGRRGGDGVEGG